MLYVFDTSVDKPDPTSFAYILDDDLLIPSVGQNPFAQNNAQFAAGVKNVRELLVPANRRKGVICTIFVTQVFKKKVCVRTYIMMRNLEL